ncbi:MFS transporter [Ectobacillus antri]|uniref:MFS transporter n=1 Tax=Ectobacillus antri TaxID=2486280 RepID=UPI000F5B41E8|nr:MFS transporter [Ectobacillus antri]
MILSKQAIRLLSFLLIISVMNATMFNVALPTIASDFALSPSQVSWVVTGYIIVYAIGSVVYGKLADQYQLKYLLTGGLGVFALGSLFGLLAQNYSILIGARLLQSLGASVIPAVAMSVPVKYVEPENRGKVLGIISSSLAFGTAIGPIISGLFTGSMGWRYLFLISLLALLTLPGFWKNLPKDQPQRGRVDVLGAGLLAATIAAVMLAITNSNTVMLMMVLLAGTLFIWRSKRTAYPFLNMELFTNKQYGKALLVSFLFSGAVFGVTFITPIMLARLNNLPPAEIGFMMFPGALAAALLGRVGGVLTDRKGSSVTVVTAFGMLMLAYMGLSTVSGQSKWFILAFLILANIGFTFGQTAMASLVSGALAREQAGAGMGVFSMLNFIASALIGAIMGKILDASSHRISVNLLVQEKSAFLFSNSYLICLALLLLASLVFMRLRRK